MPYQSLLFHFSARIKYWDKGRLHEENEASYKPNGRKVRYAEHRAHDRAWAAWAQMGAI